MNKLYVGFAKEVRPPKAGLFIDDKVPKIPLAKVKPAAQSWKTPRPSLGTPASHQALLASAITCRLLLLGWRAGGMVRARSVEHNHATCGNKTRVRRSGVRQCQRS
jgi:hypothetical protein